MTSHQPAQMAISNPQAATMATLSSHPPTMATPSPLPALMTKSIQSDPQVRDRPQTIGENIAPQIMATPATSVQAISTPAVIATTGSRAEITRQVLADLWDRGYRIPPSTFRELNRDAQTMDYTRTAPITGSLATRNQKQNRKPKVKGGVRKPSGGQTTLQKLQLMGNNLLPGHEPGMTSTDFGNFNLVSNLTLPSSVILGNNARTDNDLHGTSARVPPFANVPNNHANISISDANNPSRSGGLLSAPNLASIPLNGNIGVNSSSRPFTFGGNASTDAPNLTSKDPQHLPGYKSGLASKSFAHLFSKPNMHGQVFPGSSPIPVPIISEKIVETHRGEACITFEDCEVQQMNMLENTLLIGKFSHGRPLLSVIREHFTKSFVLKGSIEIGLVDPRHVFLSFSNPEDCIEILIKGQILFNGKCPMRIFRWTPEFDTRFETSLAPVWVLLPNLKAHCFSIPCIKQIVKPIGRFLHVDAATAKFSRPNVAKVKVEIDLMKPLRQKFFIRLGSKIPGREDFGFWQSIEYEKIPPYCLTCWKQGHLSSSCRVKRARVDIYMGNSQPPRDPSGTNNAFAGDNGSSLGVSNHPPTHRPQVQSQVTFSEAFDPQRLSKIQRKHQNRKARKEKGKSPIVESLNDVGTTTAITEVGFRRDEATTSRDTTFYIPITTSNNFAELQVDDDNQISQTAPVFQPLAPTDCTCQLSPILEDSEKAASPSTQPLLGPLPLYQGLDHAQAQEDNHSPAQPPPSSGEASSTRQVFSFPPTIPVTAGPQTPLREAGTGGCGLNTDQVLIPTISPVAHPSSPAPTVKHLRRTKSSSEGSNIAMFYREASDDESESSIAGTIALFESVGRIKTSLGHGSPPRVPHVPFGDRFTPPQVQHERSSASSCTPTSSHTPSL
nr:ABC transporter F family member 4-like [Ipomoea batatas]